MEKIWVITYAGFNSDIDATEGMVAITDKAQALRVVRYMADELAEAYPDYTWFNDLSREEIDQTQTAFRMEAVESRQVYVTAREVRVMKNADPNELINEQKEDK